MYLITAPLRVPLSAKKDFIININNYRNLHHYSLNKSKIKYKEIIANQLIPLPRMNHISIVYTVYAASARKFDLMNVVSIHSKYFLDALVESGKLPDDTYTQVIKESTAFGGIDRDNPRVEILIEEIPWP